MEHIIKAAVERGASDLHIKAGDVFRARIDGEFQPLTKQRLTPDQTKAIALQLISSDEDRDLIDSIRDYDCSWGAPGIGRFRVNILRQRSSFMIVMRTIPFEIPTIERLGLPPVLCEIALADRGIVFVTGPSGSGKSSTVAALIHHLNTSLDRHIVTLESPIEFLHRDLKSSVTQREIGVDTDSVADGLGAAMRQDADVVFCAELADAATAGLALQVAEGGALVITTLRSPDVTSTITRFIAMFPPELQQVARLRLADSLRGIVSQRLVQRVDGEGRVALLEILRAAPEVRDVLRARHRAAELLDVIAAAPEKSGMQTFAQHEAVLRDKGVIGQLEPDRPTTETPADNAASESAASQSDGAGKDSSASRSRKKRGKRQGSKDDDNDEEE